MFAIASAVVLAIASSTLAQPSPLTPLAAEVGQPCVITWTADATGKWKDTNIQLMAGSNDQMMPVTTVVTNLDTTSDAPTTYTWTCPDVTLYSAVYWYQFSHVEEPSNLIWTTRWAIESADGQTVPPPNPTQPSGQAIPWGVAELKDLSQVKPAPTYITGESTTPTNSNATTPVASGTVASTLASTATASSSMATVVVPSNSTKNATGSTGVTTGSNTTSSTDAGHASGAALTRSQGSVIATAIGAALAALFLA